MNKLTKIVLTLSGLAVFLPVDFFSFNDALDFGPSQASDGYVLNNNPVNLILRWSALAIILALLWMLMSVLIKKRPVLYVAYIAAVLALPVAYFALSIGLYGIGG